MKPNTLLRTILITGSLFAFVGGIVAQDTKSPDGPPPEAQRPDPGQRRDPRVMMFRQLGLSSEQIQQIRQINIDRKPVMEEAQRRYREANRALDQAIYADQVDQANVETCLKEVQLAQAEVSKIRYMNELAVRSILTPEQLVRFRDLRQRFEQTRRNSGDRPPPDGDHPGGRRERRGKPQEMPPVQPIDPIEAQPPDQ